MKKIIVFIFLLIIISPVQWTLAAKPQRGCRREALVETRTLE